MKYINKFLLPLFALLAMAFSVLGQTSASGNLTATNNIISTLSGQIVRLQLTDTSGAANTFVVYDSDVATTTNRIKPAYFARTFYSTNEVISVTNALGRVESITNTVRASVTATVAASTNEMRRVYTVTVPANSTTVLEPAGVLSYTFGYTIKALGTGSYNTDYIPSP